MKFQGFFSQFPLRFFFTSSFVTVQTHQVSFEAQCKHFQDLQHSCTYQLAVGLALLVELFQPQESPVLLQSRPLYLGVVVINVSAIYGWLLLGNLFRGWHHILRWIHQRIRHQLWCSGRPTLLCCCVLLLLRFFLQLLLRLDEIEYINTLCCCQTLDRFTWLMYFINASGPRV